MLQAMSTSMTSPRAPLWDSSHLEGQGFRLVGSGVGLQVGGLSGWVKWMRFQVGGAPLDKLSVVVPPVTANAAQTAT